ncbi:hypothetical protein CC86DRAFT_289559 [Ophiobolus disseminans]|uniref:Heterokaryon incompatibility domain-containing protein n=1 Tax=Ophiobolus disseminans TaxID=1469910 RepID=A0A6A7A3E6_9PLEO|nr:hypothetical protein CC86DRAFT_289559 [Ophiobolus disseminans]
MARLTPHKTKLWEARDAALTVSFEDIYIYNHPIRGSSEIRLLTLIPSKSEVSELEAHLCVVSLQPTPPEYEALSYVWKEQPEYSPFADLEPWPLRLGTSRFMISRCLANILFHLRDRYQPRMLWIDAICIDQASAVEKNHQVRQMCNIYSMARRVIIWLGETVYKKEDIFAEKHRLRQEFLYGPPLRIKREFWSRTWWSRIWYVA